MIFNSLHYTWLGQSIFEEPCSHRTSEGMLKEKLKRDIHTLIFYLHTQSQRSHFCCLCQQEILAAFHPFVGFLFLEPVFGKKLFCFSVWVVILYCLNWNVRRYVLLSTVDQFFKAFQCFCSLIRKNHLQWDWNLFHIVPCVFVLTYWSLLPWRVWPYEFISFWL